VNDLVDRLAGRMEETADRIFAETESDAVRRRAMAQNGSCSRPSAGP
jgi:hypothetical protein